MDLETIDDGAFTRDYIKRHGLIGFMREFWHVFEPSAPFIEGWHIGAMCEHLEAVSRREITHLVINVPPGSGKSSTVCVAWPSWVWTLRPGSKGTPAWVTEKHFGVGHRWIFGSFDDSLVLRDARRTLAVLTSEKYAAAWPEFSIELGQRDSDYKNEDGGTRFSTSVGGKGTGKHAHTIVCDDPTKAQDWNSPKALTRASEWWSGAMSTRVAHPADFHARVLIMQRLADGDLAGEALREQGYEHLCIEMEYEPNKTYDFGSSIPKNDPRTEPDELMCPERFNAEAVGKIKKALKSPAKIAAQLQQNPTPKTGGVIEEGWLKREWSWDMFPKLRFMRFVQSWDFGFKGTDESHSRVHGCLLAEFKGRVYLIDEIRPKHITFRESLQLIKDAQKRPHWDLARIKLVEDKANGIAIMNMLQAKIPGLYPVTPDGSKLERISAHSDFIETDGLWVPTAREMPTIADWRHEIYTFPRGSFDDRVDTLSQGLDHLLGKAQKLHDGLSKIRAQRTNRAGRRSRR